jgi:hypothetical protein
LWTVARIANVGAERAEPVGIVEILREHWIDRIEENQ